MAAAPVAARAGLTARAGAGAAARGGAGKAAAGKAATGSKAAQQAEAIQAIKDARPADKPAGDVDDQSGRQLPSITVNTKGGTGGGFVLGMLVYAVGLTYLRGGKPAVKQLLRAKFLNDTSPA
jgi:hypothetical protein